MNDKLNDKDLINVNGGADDNIRKDEYENIILGVSAEEHNVMLNSELMGEMLVYCPFCHLRFPISKIEEHKAICSERPDAKYK